MKHISRKIKTSVAAILVLFVFAVSQIAVRAARNARLSALFDGPYQTCEPEPPGYYLPVVYDLTEYMRTDDQLGSDFRSTGSEFATKSSQGEIPWVDGEAREDVEAALRRAARLDLIDGMTGATPVARLRSPSVYRDRRPSRSLQVISPEDGALFPPNLCAPYVEWEDPRNNLWQVVVQVDEKNEKFTFLTSNRRWRFPSEMWERLRRDTVAHDARIQVKGVRVDKAGQRIGEVQASRTVRFRISQDPADNYIVYRLVDPPFSSYKTPDLFIRDIREDEPRLFLSARQTYCINCHTFSSNQGNVGKLGLQVRNLGPTRQKLKVYLAFYDIDADTGYKIQLPFETQMTTFMAWSPDGQKLAFSANQKIVALKPILFETQLAAMSASDIAILDVRKSETYLLPGASDPYLLEVYPRWSPDSCLLVFSRSPVGQHPAHIRFDLYAIPMDGSDESVAYPIEGACSNGRSNYFPRFSPDGKWFSFCQCDGGDLIRSSSDIYLKAGTLEGPTRRLESNVAYAADSWHSWSSNSRWLVFSSKRDGGIYAYLYLTHIDELGRASPAVPLPVKEKPYASFNIPESVANDPGIREADLFNAVQVEREPHAVREKKV